MPFLFKACERIWLMVLQVGFLTEWQLYAQKLEGDQWVGERMDPNKIDKMSGNIMALDYGREDANWCRSANWTDV